MKLVHWQAVVDHDALKKGGLRECPRLTADHLHPNPWQKMNVAMARQVFTKKNRELFEVDKCK